MWIGCDEMADVPHWSGPQLQGVLRQLHCGLAVNHIVNLGSIGSFPFWFLGQLSLCPQEGGLNCIPVARQCRWIFHPGVPGMPVCPFTVFISSCICKALLTTSISLSSARVISLPTGWQFPQRQPPHLGTQPAPMLSHFHHSRKLEAVAVELEC